MSQCVVVCLVSCKEFYANTSTQLDHSKILLSTFISRKGLILVSMIFYSERPTIKKTAELSCQHCRRTLIPITTCKIKCCEAIRFNFFF